jgi:hypothetical protein
MRKLTVVCLAWVLIVFMSVVGASAGTYFDHFPSDDSTVVASIGFIPPFSYGYFFSKTDGHMVEETFTGTGLTSVVGLELNLVVTEDSLTSTLGWDVFVNDVFVGNWFQRAIDGTGPKEFDFVFSDIIGNGTYTVAMKVRNDVPLGEGSIALGFTSDPFPAQLLLVGCACPVPIPGAVWLLGSGLVGLLGFRKKLTA